MKAVNHLDSTNMRSVCACVGQNQNRFKGAEEGRGEQLKRIDKIRLQNSRDWYMKNQTATKPYLTKTWGCMRFRGVQKMPQHVLLAAATVRWASSMSGKKQQDRMETQDLSPRTCACMNHVYWPKTSSTACGSRPVSWWRCSGGWYRGNTSVPGQKEKQQYSGPEGRDGRHGLKILSQYPAFKTVSNNRMNSELV